MADENRDENVRLRAALEPVNDRATVLTEAERTMLAYALKQAQEQIWAQDGFTADDQAALDSLLRMAAEAQAAPCGRPTSLTIPCSAGDWCCKGPGATEALCRCGHGKAYHDAKYADPQCSLCPEDGERMWRHAYTPAAPQPAAADNEEQHVTPADELRTAADKMAPEPETRPTLTGEHPDLDACYAQIFRDTATACDAVTRHGVGPDETASWLAPALAAARAINGGEQQ